MIEQYLNKIYNMDCLEFLKNIPDDSIDLIVTDPPYGDNIGYGRNNKEILNNEDETINYKVIPLLYNKIKNGGVVYLFTNWKFTTSIQNFIKEKTNFNLRMQIVIVKNNIGMGYGFRNQYELCLVLEKGKPVYRLNDFSNVMNMEHINHNDFSRPHEKGKNILKKIILHSSNEGDVVLDCFCGSGSTLIASKELKRNFIGIELDEKWYNYSKNRIENTNGTLF